MMPFNLIFAPDIILPMKTKIYGFPGSFCFPYRRYESCAHTQSRDNTPLYSLYICILIGYYILKSYNPYCICHAKGALVKILSWG